MDGREFRKYHYYSFVTGILFIMMALCMLIWVEVFDGRFSSSFGSCKFIFHELFVGQVAELRFLSFNVENVIFLGVYIIPSSFLLGALESFYRWVLFHHQLLSILSTGLLQYFLLCCIYFDKSCTLRISLKSLSLILSLSVFFLNCSEIYHFY